MLGLCCQIPRPTGSKEQTDYGGKKVPQSTNSFPPLEKPHNERQVTLLY